MTLEEKAKKLANTVPLRRDIPFQDYIRTQLASMYYTGAVENGIIWHNLRQNPEDLPPVHNSNDYLSKNVFLDTGVIGYYNYSQKRWFVDMGNRLDKPVIAWCEVPQYTEETIE